MVVTARAIYQYCEYEFAISLLLRRGQVWKLPFWHTNLYLEKYDRTDRDFKFADITALLGPQNPFSAIET